MTNRSDAIVLAVALGILALAPWALLHITAQCYAAGGTVVRGPIWLECIQ